MPYSALANCRARFAKAANVERSAAKIRCMSAACSRALRSTKSAMLCRALLPRMRASNRRVGREIRRALLQKGVDPLAPFGAGHAHEFERERCIEDRRRLAQPMIERLLGPAHGRGCEFGQAGGDLDGFRVELGILD